MSVRLSASFKNHSLLERGGPPSPIDPREENYILVNCQTDTTHSKLNGIAAWTLQKMIDWNAHSCAAFLRPFYCTPLVALLPPYCPKCILMYSEVYHYEFPAAWKKKLIAQIGAVVLTISTAISPADHFSHRSHSLAEGTDGKPGGFWFYSMLVQQNPPKRSPFHGPNVRRFLLNLLMASVIWPMCTRL